MATGSDFEAVAAFLESRGLKLSEFKAFVRKLNAAAGILVVGSVAEHRATPSSDLDLLVLSDSQRVVAPVAIESEVPHPTTIGMESLGFLGDLELNVEYVRADQLNELSEMMEPFEASVRGHGVSQVLPVPDARQLRLMHRLRVGVPVLGWRAVQRWRRQAKLAQLPGLLAVLYFVTALDYLEDATAWASLGDDWTATLMAREAGTAITQALISIGGGTHPDFKWAALEAQRLRDSPVGRLLSEARQIWLPAPTTLWGDEYVKRVASLCEETFVLGSSLAGLRKEFVFIDRYCRGRYRLALSFLGE